MTMNDETPQEKLSDEEVDALLGEVDNLDLGSERAPEGSVRDYDFASQERIVSGGLLGLHAINERFIRNFRTSLMNLLRRTVNVSLQEISSVKFYEYLATLSMPSCINLFRMRPLQGQSLCVFETPLVFTLVDSLFGGGSIVIDSQKEKEEFTQMEMRIVHLVLDLVFDDLANAWQTIYPIKCEAQGSEINPQLVNVASQNEVLIIARYKILLEGTKSSELHIAIPYSTIEPIRSTLESGQLESDDIDEEWRVRLREEVFDAPIEITGNLGYSRLRFKELIAMKVGDVVPLTMHENITVLASGLPTFRAKFGVSNNQCAVKIMGRVDRL